MSFEVGAAVAVVLIVFAALLAVLKFMKSKGLSFTVRVFSALGMGIVLGVAMQLALGRGSDAAKCALDWMSLVGTGYISLLKMLVMPLIFVAIVGAFTRTEATENLGKIGISVLVVLLGTVAIAAVFGWATIALSGLAGADFTQGTVDASKMDALQTRSDKVAGTTIPQTILSFIPTNVFSDLAGTRSTSTIAVVIFSALVGLAYLKLRNRDSEQADFFRRIIDSLYGIVMCIVKMVIGLTPYGVMALIANVMATSDFAAIVDLGKFIIFSYVAIIAMFIVHLIILAANRVNPVTYLKKAFPVLSFAFVSRTSAGALPMNIETQSKALGVDEATANFAASFGMSIGQNGCAGIYPAMMATLPASLRSCLLRLRHLVCSHDDLAHLVGVCACVCREGGGRRGRVFEAGDFAHVPGDVVPSAAGETCVWLHSHERKAERAVQALACGVRGGHHAVDRLYAHKAQKLDERGVQAASRALALRGGRKVDGKLGVPLEGDAFAQLMGVGEPDDASAFLGDEAGVLLADAHDALAVCLARGDFFLEGHGRVDEGGVHRADPVRVIGRGQADAQL